MKEGLAGVDYDEAAISAIMGTKKTAATKAAAGKTTAAKTIAAWRQRA